MNKQEFLQELKVNLGFLKQNEIEDVMLDYEEYFNNEIESGKTEEQIASELGNPILIAKKFIPNGGVEREDKNFSKPENTDFFGSQMGSETNEQSPQQNAQQNFSNSNANPAFTLGRAISMFVAAIVLFAMSIAFFAASVAMFTSLVATSVAALVYGFSAFYIFANIGVALGAFLLGIGWVCLVIAIFPYAIKLPKCFYKILNTSFTKNFNPTVKR